MVAGEGKVMGIKTGRALPKNGCMLHQFLCLFGQLFSVELLESIAPPPKLMGSRPLQLPAPFFEGNLALMHVLEGLWTA